MPGNAALLLVQAALVAVRPGADTDCPSARDLSESLRARLPAALVPFEKAASDPDVFVLAVTADAAGVPTLSVTDSKGGARLRRTLPAPGPARDRDCPALADTVALIVERFLHGLEVRDPPPAPKPARVADLAATAPAPPVARPVPGPRAWDLAVGSAWRPGASGLAAFQLRAAASRILGPVRLGLALGAAGASSERWAGAGEGRLRRYLGELSLLYRRIAWRGEAQAGVAAGADLLSLEASAGTVSQSELKLAPALGAELAYRLPIAGRLFGRLVTGVHLSLVRYDFVTRSGNGEAAFGTDRLYGKLGGELGLSFW